MTVILTFDGTDQQVRQMLEKKAITIVDALAVRMDYLMLKLQAHIAGDLLQGQVLHHRSGKLSGSIRKMPTALEGGALVGSVEGAGGPAWYGKVHEFGGVFDVKGRKITQIFGHKVTPFQSKSYQIHFPERSFMRRGLADQAEAIENGLQEAADKAVQQ